MLIDMKRLLFLLAFMFAALAAHGAEPLLAYTDARRVESDIDDGDSFWAEVATTSILVRLYFVDCPETSAFSDAMARRVREQTRYFGLADARTTLEFGGKAKAVTLELLARPFTVHTAFAPGGGASSDPRVYAFITLEDGRDLAATLVQKGFARAKGTGRPTPGGALQAEEWDRLRDLEAAAMLRRAGIWAHADAERIAEARALQREEDGELRAITRGGTTVMNATGLVNINKATREELDAVAGIGPVTASAIIEGRPYTNVDDLVRIPGLGPKMLGRLESALTVGSSNAP